MGFSEFPVELILEVASYLGFGEDCNQTSLALTCRHMYATLIPGIIEDRRQCIQHSVPYVAHNYANNLHLNLSGYDSELDAKQEPFGGSYKLLDVRPGNNKKEFLSIQSIIARAKDLDAVHVHLGDRMPGLARRQLAALIGNYAVRPNSSLTVFGDLPFDPFQHSLEFGVDTNGRGPFKFEPLAMVVPKVVQLPGNRSRNKYGNKLGSLLKKVPVFVRRFPGIRKPPPQIYSNAFHGLVAVPRRPRVELPLSPHCQLTSLCIAGDTLFLPSFYPFTKKLLNTANLTKLSLSRIRLNLFIWAEILPALTIPSLREFSIAKVSIAFPDLLKFLGRRCHDSIEVLDFTGNDPIGVVKVSPLCILPRLTSLTGTVEYLVPFLESRIEGNFPALQEVGISAPRPPYTTSNELNPVYELILNGSPLKSIKVDNIWNSGMAEWIINTSNSERWPVGNPFTALEQLSIDDVFSISQELYDVLVKWFNSISSENQVLGRLSLNSNSSEIFTSSNPLKSPLEQFIWYTFPNLINLNVTSQKQNLGHWNYYPL